MSYPITVCRPGNPPMKLYPQQQRLLGIIRAEHGGRIAHNHATFDRLAKAMGWKNGGAAADAVTRLVWRGHLIREGHSGYRVIESEGGEAPCASTKSTTDPASRAKVRSPAP